MSARFLFLAILLLLPSALARADYGWIPEYKKLIAKAGLDVFSTDGNFDNDGSLAALPSNARLKDTIFWLSAEYGIAESWALAFEFPLYLSALDSPTARLAESSSLGDITARLKWAVKPVTPIVTIETFLKFPSGKSGAATGELATGDGNFDLGIFLHSGHRGGSFLFSLSPGFLARFGGYSMAGAAEFAIQFMFPRGFIRVFGTGIFSFEDKEPFDTSTTVHNAPGSGGSYARLNGSPIGFSAGAKISLKITPQVSFEFGGTKGIIGSRYPDYIKVGGDIAVEFDFFEAPKTLKAKEVPFNFDYQKY